MKATKKKNLSANRWSDSEYELFRTKTDKEISAITGRTKGAVTQRRIILSREGFFAPAATPVSTGNERNLPKSSMTVKYKGLNLEVPTGSLVKVTEEGIEVE